MCNATDYHYNNIEGTAGKIIPDTKSEVNELGIYKAKVEVNGIVKKARSTFFPDDMDSQEVVDAIAEAYDGRSNKKGREYFGYTKDGMQINMYLDEEDKIISAFPIY